MAKKPTPAPANLTAPINTALVKSDIKAANDYALATAQHESAVRAIAITIGYQLPSDFTDPDLIQRDVATNMRRSVEACLEVGKGLTVLKAACGHGNFVARLDVLGIEPSVAWRFMQSATKFAKLPTSATLKAIGNQTKLFEMLVLDDEQIAELELTGQTGELSLDDVATMSVKELRAALREERQEHEATKKVSLDKSTSNDKLRNQLKRIKDVPPDETLQKIHAELSDVASASIGMVRGKLRMGFQAVVDHLMEHGTGDNDSAYILAGYVNQLQVELISLRAEFHLPDQVGDGTPAWEVWNQQQDAKKNKKAAH